MLFLHRAQTTPDEPTHIAALQQVQLNCDQEKQKKSLSGTPQTNTSKAHWLFWQTVAQRVLWGLGTLPSTPSKYQDAETNKWVSKTQDATWEAAGFEMDVTSHLSSKLARY